MLTWSPLRYPGGKGQMYKFVVHLIEANNLLGCHYIEPFAGGAGVAIRLLLEGKVKSIAINDYDRSIYAVWHCIIYETERFIDKIDSCSIDMDTWYRQKNIQKKKESVDLFELGFSTLFLNRTNRSGILKAGPIGGLSQNGNYKMDCRFNKPRLIQLIRRIADYRPHIFLSNMDGKDFIQVVDKENSFSFIDPPYYHKGKELYVNFFEHEDHSVLSDSIRKHMMHHSFILTYDYCPEVLELYSYLPIKTVELNYFLGKKRKAQEAMFTNCELRI